MENILNRPYEISIWEDFTPTEDKSYYQERKLMIIGSNEMTAPLRATNPILTENVNGTHTLRFTLNSRYFDEEQNDFVDNPFLPYMVNERKVKLHYKDEWYDFVIKDIEEDSVSHSFNYTLIDSFINELSKNGFNIELDTELENNQGTIGELAGTIVEETDWKIGHVDTLVQTNVEALYATKIAPGMVVTAVDMKTLNSSNPTTIQIVSKEDLTGNTVQPIVYVFYSSALDSTIPMQFLYREDGNYTVDEDGVVNNAPNYLLVAGEVKPNMDNGAINDFRGKRLVQKEVTKYDPLTDKFITVYEDKDKNELYMFEENEYISPTMVQNFIASNKNFPTTSGWNSPSINSLNTFIYPPMDDPLAFNNTKWASYLRIKYGANNSPIYNSGVISNTKLFSRGITEGEEFVLRIKYGISTSEKGKPAQDTSYNLRAKIASYTINENGEYQFDGADEILSFIGKTPITETTIDPDSDLKFVYYRAKATKSVSYSDLKNTKEPIGIFFSLNTPDLSNYYFIQDAQMFVYKTGLDGKIIFPETTPESAVKKNYYYYYPKQIKELDSTLSLLRHQIILKIGMISDAKADELVEVFRDKLIDTGIVNLAIEALNNAVNESFGDIDFDAGTFQLGLLRKDDDVNSMLYTYVGDKKSPDYTVKYDKTFEKIRSITARESNRFNLIQTLCETFECWPEFVIEHDENGAITIGPDGPQKTINFYEYVGKDNYAGFKYGINLKSIKRTLDSEQIVSKIIVNRNSNEYGIDGFCDIARSRENPTGENFLLDFRYYVQQGLLDGNEVNNDLYLYVEGGKYLGYYVQLNRLNKEYDSYITEASLLEVSVTNINAAYATFKLAYDNAITEINEKKQEIQNFCGVDYDILVANQDKYNNFIGNKAVKDLLTRIQVLNKVAKDAKGYFEQKSDQKIKALNRLSEIEVAQEQVLKKKIELNSKFYKKYSKYIQEGSWISEDYFDDNLYYLDSEDVLHRSAFPEISYTIDVLELSQLEEFENYNFAVGDKTYIEDTEFFGYKEIDGVKTPYKEEVILSEVVYDLDNPQSNQIKIQNYKTQFEDLFQRINAVTQALQYQSGSYDKAAGAFNPDGSIKDSNLQNSMINNSLIIKNATDQSVVWDETGITVTNLAKPNEIVRIVSGGILITSNGGETWSAGITGAGINTNYLTAGQIDASRINIMSGGYPSFRWDADGITAYKFEKIDGKPTNFLFNNFVRLDQYGLYGINHDEDFIADSIEEIEESAQFGLTWNGFFIRSDHSKGDYSVDGKIEISSDNDFQVIDGLGIERIKIGLLKVEEILDADGIGTGRYNGYYGLKLSDSSGNPVLSSDDTGMLWLTGQIDIGPREYTQYGDIYYKPRTQLGILQTWDAGKGDIPESTAPYSKIFSVRDGSETNEESFVIYDTGKFIARNAEIHGDIYAEGGKIGGLDVASLGDGLSKMEVTTNTGTVIRQATDGTLAPQIMKFTPKFIGVDVSKGKTIDWTYSQDGENYNHLATTNIGLIMDDDGNEVLSDGVLIINASTLHSIFNLDGVLYIKAQAEKNATSVFEDDIVLTLIKEVDLSDIDLDVDVYNIDTNYPDILKWYNTDTKELSFSPNDIDVQSYKGDVLLTSSEIEYEIWMYSNKKNSYNTNEDKWFRIDGQIPEFIYDATNEIFISTGNMIDSPFKQFIEFVTDTKYKIRFEDFYNYLNTYVGIDNFVKTILTIILEENTSLKIKLIDSATKKVKNITPITIVFGTTADMATFAINADSIDAAIRNSKLSFDSNGLHIINGGIDIKNRQEIINEDETITIAEEELFKITEEGKLWLNGTGYFEGNIYAENGYFKGKVVAEGGSLSDLNIIGKIQIGNNLFINGSSTDDNPLIGFYTGDYSPNGDTGFYISENGIITANTINLGAGANIKKYIKIGNGWIINTDWLNNQLSLETPEEVITTNNLNENSFIVIKDNNTNDLLNIRQDGIITIGKDSGIELNGKEQSIKSFNYITDKFGWSITPEEVEFNNAIIRGSLKTTTFEYEENTAQSIGSVLLVKPSSAIKKVETVTNTLGEIITLDLTTETDLKVNNEFVKIGHSKLGNNVFLGNNIPVNEEATEFIKNKIRVLIDSSLVSSLDFLDDLIGVPLINMGSTNTPSIVINGSTSNATYPKAALSIFENNIITDKDTGYYSLSPEVKLILGEMPKSVMDKTFGVYNEKRYGLYAENVFLKGALISEGKGSGDEEDDSAKLFYSGMNTDSTVKFESRDAAHFEKSGNIILWAGANLADADRTETDPDGSETVVVKKGQIDIQRAKFKVDNLGNLYANSGYFVGTIITDATITASKIQTAVLEGYEHKNEDGEITGTEAALTIRNAELGIKFEKGSDVVMELNTSGLNLNTNLNVGDNFTIRSDSSLVVPITIFSKVHTTERMVIITPNKVGFTNEINLPTGNYEEIGYNSYITSNTEGLAIFGTNNIPIASFNSEKIDIKRNSKFTGEIISFADETGDKVQFKIIKDESGIIGYDLYLS